ncbi:MAG TPA: hypothetical protein VM076_06550 [Gemmatimonadaceae bacterium]|nr:hypothetical protein [Gemmatimonadaceae bacterium]
MSERRGTHNGRDASGNFKVKQEDVDDLRTDPDGSDIIRDDVRLGGAVADIGPDAGQRGEHIGELVEENRDDVARTTGGRPRKGK